MGRGRVEPWVGAGSSGRGPEGTVSRLLMACSVFWLAGVCARGPSASDAVRRGSISDSCIHGAEGRSLVRQCGPSRRAMRTVTTTAT